MALCLRLALPDCFFHFSFFEQQVGHDCSKTSIFLAQNRDLSLNIAFFRLGISVYKILEDRRPIPCAIDERS